MSGYIGKGTPVAVEDGSVEIEDLSATGTPSSTTFLRGDNSWQVVNSTPSITDNGDATAITIDSSENVGIGVVPDTFSSGYTALQLNGYAYNIAHSGGDHYITNNAYFNTGWKYGKTSTAQKIQLASGKIQFDVAPSGTADSAISFTTAMTIDNSGGISKDGSFDGTGSSDDFYWNTGGGDRFRFHSGTTSSRDLLGFSNPNGVVGKIETVGSGTLYNTGNGGGIDFSGNANASGMTSEVLDDYEEGTWTPSLDYGTSIAYTSRSGRYTKIGRFVHCTAEIVVSNSSSDGSAIQIGSLPYTGNNDEQSVNATLGRYTSFLGAKATAMRNTRFTGTVVILMEGDNNAIQYNEVASSGTLQIAFTYATS